MNIAIRFFEELVENDIILVDLNVNKPTRETDKLHYDDETSRKLFRRMKRFFFRFSCKSRACGFICRVPLPDSKRNHIKESKDLIFAPSCEGDIIVEEAIDVPEEN